MVRFPDVFEIKLLKVLGKTSTVAIPALLEGGGGGIAQMKYDKREFHGH